MAEVAHDPAADAVAVVRGVWERMRARDWAGARVLLAGDLHCELPASGELVTSGDAFIAFQSEYPEGWDLLVQRVVDAGPSAALSDGGPARLVVSEVEVPHEGVGTFAVAQLAWVRDGVVVALREFWVTCAGEESPSWRAHLVDRYDGRLTR